MLMASYSSHTSTSQVGLEAYPKKSLEEEVFPMSEAATD